MKRLVSFVDSDVVISSLISSSGAAFHLLASDKHDYYISDLSQKEIEQVVTRLQLDKIKLENLIKGLKKIKISTKKNFKQYVSDPYDSHIVAGADKANSKFLITYNLKHYRLEKIKAELNIIVLTPANFLQYLRSIKIV